MCCLRRLAHGARYVGASLFTRKKWRHGGCDWASGGEHTSMRNNIASVLRLMESELAPSLSTNRGAVAMMSGSSKK
eukprot:scaffold102590_cov31-Tisochrysis_lutea.AAC.2